MEEWSHEAGGVRSARSVYLRDVTEHVKCVCLLIPGPIASAVSDRWSCRTCMFIGGVIASGSLAVGSQTDTFGRAFLTLGILSGEVLLQVFPVDLSLCKDFHNRHRVNLMQAKVNLELDANNAAFRQ